jgi:hypothetical protein
MLTHIKAA